MALLSEYGFNENTGVTTQDSSGNNHTLTATSSSNWTDGHTGTAAGGEFSGIISGAGYTEGQPFTMMWWMKTPASVGDWATIITNGSNYYLELSTDYSINIYNGNGLHFNSGANTITPGQFVHVALTGQKNNVSTKIYINGVEKTTGVTNATMGWPVGIFNTNVSVGGGGGDTPCNLHIDDFRLFDTILTSAEVGTWMNTPAGTTVQPPADVVLTPTSGDAQLGYTSPTVPNTLVPVHSFATGVSSNGRYFVDQTGRPFIMWGDSPWSMFVDLSVPEMIEYMDNRLTYGINTILVSAIGATENGGPANNGATYDGVLPFIGGNVTQFNEAYWQRVDAAIAAAEERGLTVMFYAMDGWVIAPGCVFNGVSAADCQTYGSILGQRYSGYQNIFWAFGGDYYTTTTADMASISTTDQQFAACWQGIKSTGYNRLSTIQMIYNQSLSSEFAMGWTNTSWGQNNFWQRLIVSNFAYSYFSTYDAVLRGYNQVWNTTTGLPATRPVFYGEGEYENSTVGTNGAQATIRRQFGWALTSGACGAFSGQQGVWNFESNWRTLLNTPIASQLRSIRQMFNSLAWWELIPDQSNTLVTAGRGQKLTVYDGSQGEYNNVSNYVTAARNASHTLAVIYMPNAANAITIDQAQMAAGTTARWVDPSDGTSVSTTWTNTYSRSTANAAGGTDWFLVLEVVSQTDTSGKVFVNGHAYPVFVHDGSQWVERKVYYHNGSEWKATNT